MFTTQLTQQEYSLLFNRMTQLYGKLDEYIFKRVIETTENSVGYYKRIRAFRIDLRFANDHLPEDFDAPAHFQYADKKAITRFFDSLKSQLRVYRRNNGIISVLDDFKYVWVREIDESTHHHYHLVLFFDREIYYPLGNFASECPSGLAAMIIKAWCSALRVTYPEYAHLVHFPDNCAYNLCRKSATLQDKKYVAALERFSYLAKVNTKTVGDGYRNFGCSQFEKNW